MNQSLNSSDLDGSTITGQDQKLSLSEELPRLPGFEVQRILGRGGMGIVYLASQLSLRRQVALKMILSGAYASLETLKRFSQEASIIAKLHHPHIVQVFEFGSHQGQPFFALEFVEGESLAQKIGGKPQPVRWSCELIAKSARAIYFAHQHGIIHRDLKPGNILLTIQNEPKIGDFGLAKEINSEQGLTKTAEVIGTPHYMAPEQAGSNAKAITPAVDVYALGVILYELLTGRPPFVGETPLLTLLQVMGKEPVSVRSLRPEIDANLATICMKCLEKEPQKRFVSAQALAEDLERYLAGQTILARPAGKIEKTLRWCRRNRALASSLVVLAIVLFGATISLSILYVQAREHAADLQSMNQFLLKDVIAQVNPFQSKGWNVSFEEAIDYASTHLRDRFAQRPEVEAQIRGVLGEAYLQMERPQKAEPHLRRAMELYSQCLGVNHRHTLGVYYNLVRTLALQGKHQEEHHERAIVESLVKEHLAPTDSLSLVIARDHAIDLVQDHKPEGWSLLTHVLETQQKTLGPLHEEALDTLEELATLSSWQAQTSPEKAKKTEEYYRACWQGRKQVYGEDDPRTMQVEIKLAFALPEQEAEPVLQRSLERHQRVLGPVHSQTLATTDTVAAWFASKKRYEEAANLYLALAEALPQSAIHDREGRLLVTRDNLANQLLRLGRFVQAEAPMRQAWERCKMETCSYPGKMTVLNNFIFTLIWLNRTEEAGPLVEEQYQLQLKLNEPDARKRYCRFRGDLLTRQGKYAEAEVLLREYLTLVGKQNPPNDVDRAFANLLLGSCLMEQERFSDAEAHLLESYQLLSVLVEQLTFGPFYSQETARRLMRFYGKWNKPQLASEWKRKAE